MSKTERLADAGKTMSKEDEAIHWINLFKQGEKIECRHRDFTKQTKEFSVWYEISKFDDLLELLITIGAEIRVKPKKLRAFTAEELMEVQNKNIKFNSVRLNEDDECENSICRIVGAAKYNGRLYAVCINESSETILIESEVLKDMKDLDGNPCGVEER